MRVDGAAQFACDFLVRGHAHHFRVQVLRSRIDVVGADHRDASIHDDALGVQDVRTFVLAHVDAGAYEPAPVLQVRGLREQAVGRAE
jgi:hypothetical protein